MECNGCTLCCLVADVPVMDAPSGVQCRHCTLDGCGIHADRPSICSDYWCIYQREKLNDNLHPNNCHILFERLDGCNSYIGTVDPEYHRNWVSDAVNDYVDSKLAEGISVVIVDGEDRFIKAPEGIEHKMIINDLAKAYGKWQQQHTQPI